MSVSPVIQLSEDHPGYEELVYEAYTLLSSYPPPFIYANDPANPHLTAAALRAVLANLSSTSNLRHAIINGVACFTPRLLYDSVLNALAGWKVTWESGCRNWGGSDDDQRWNENLDGFVHGLRRLHTEFSQDVTMDQEKERGQEYGSGEGPRIVIMIERSERLKDTMADLLVPLTRLAELSRLDLTVIFVSQVQWESIRPSLGASPDPYYIDSPTLSKDAVIRRLTSFFSTTRVASTPVLLPLYSHFISTLYSTCSQFTQDPHELAYIAAARWPGFVQPVLDAHRRDILLAGAQDDGAMDDDAPEPAMAPPSEDTRMRLARLFAPSFKAALEALHPRLTNAADWAARNAPEADILAKPPGYALPLPPAVGAEGGADALPRMSKFILVAAFLASSNPAKTDLRMFGRGLDEKKRRARARKAPSGSKSRSGPAKIPQRLLGPTPFPLDRLIALLGALLEENDVDTRPPAPQFTIPGEYTDMEISRVGIYSSIMQLTSMRLLHRTSAPDKLDGPPMFKCGISYDLVLSLARQLDVPLNDLLWDPA